MTHAPPWRRKEITHQCCQAFFDRRQIEISVFPTDRDRWYPASRFLRRTIVNFDGTFRLAGLPAGSYYAAAVAKLPPDGDEAWLEPAYLESLVPRATDFSLGEGQKQSLTLKLANK